MKRDRPSVLIFFGASGRSQPASGPVQSLMALMHGLGSEMDFTFAIAPGLANRLSGKPRQNTQNPKICAVQGGSMKRLRETLRANSPDLIMLSSFFDREFTLPVLSLKKLGAGGRSSVILSPRGEFASGALSLKAGRKRAFMNGARFFGLTRDVWFHATADHERSDIEGAGLPGKGILSAPNARVLAPTPKPQPRRGGPVRLVFLGRITPVKNLHVALDVLSRVAVPVEFNIFGPIADADYWTDCQRQIAGLPDHVAVKHGGVLDHADIPETLVQHDLFFLPTKGENFGHAINDALSAGLPALIADTTPWRGLAETNAGWDLPLDDVQGFVRAIENFAAIEPDARDAMRHAARALAERSFEESDALEANRRMLWTALQSGQG